MGWKPHQEVALQLSEQHVIPTIQHIWQLLRVSQHYPQVKLMLPDSRDVSLKLPETLLDQLLSNLISNSLQAGATTLCFSFHFAPERFYSYYKMMQAACSLNN